MENEIGIVKKIGNFVSNFLLGETKETIIRTDEAVRRIDKDFDVVKEDVKSIDRRLGRIEGRFMGRGAEGIGSPLNPTEMGQKYLRESGLYKTVDQEEREFLLQKLRNSLPPDYTDYDVQEVARSLMGSLENDPMMKPIKDYAFNNGLDVGMILRLGGLLLRDNFLKTKHKIAGSSTQ